MDSMNPKLTEAREFLDKKDDGLAIFEVEWTQKVTWFVAAASKEKAEEAAKEVDVNDLDFDDPDVFVSGDLTEAAKVHSKKLNREITPHEPDSGVHEGQVLHINEYLALRVWSLICECMGTEMKCPECGHEDWTSMFNLNSDPPKYGHVPIMGCPKCRHPLGWVQLVSKKQQVDDETVPLFGEEGEGEDG
jgi:hypothetical protein